MRHIIFFSLFSFFLFFLNAYPEEIRTDFLWDRSDLLKSELVEDIPQYDCIIDWTSGKVHTEAEVNAGSASPNLGKYLNNKNAILRDDLRQNLIKAMGYIRISDIFLLKDYYAMKSEIRYEFIAMADKAFYYPLTQKGRKIKGIAELNLFGKDSIANVFFRNLEKYELTNYVKEDSSESAEYFDGLVIDTMTFQEFNPSIQFRIYDQSGNLLYGPETEDQDKLEKYGVCQYTTSLRYAFDSPRSGNRVFYVIPYAITGRMNTYIVLHNKDAARLFANPKTVRFLNQGRVVVVRPPRK